MKTTCFSVCLVAACSASLAVGEVKLPAVIGDNMVLQQSTQAAIWGQAAAGEEVTVTLAGKKTSAKADDAGNWSVKLKTPKAGGPYEMTVTGAANTIVVRNVLVGEVWVCSGQSNMVLPLEGDANAATALASADCPKIRLFHVPARFADQPANDLAARWQVCDPNTVAGFSAVAYYFGRDLHNLLGCPVGLIFSAVGGTKAEWWTSRRTFETDPNLQEALEDYHQRAAAFSVEQAAYEKALAAWKEAAEKAKAEGKEEPVQPRGPRPIHPLGSLFNGMIAPLTRYAVAGVIWYQGESDADQWMPYRKVFPGMIADWRKHWGRQDLPFLYVQLPNYRKRLDKPSDADWSRQRESQLMTLATPHTAMAVTIDVGDPNTIHPANKQPVGLRLSLAAQKLVYGRDVAYSGPIMDTVKFEGGKAVVTFKHAENGLVAKGDKLTGFALAGANRRFFWADAVIEGSTVAVTCPEVTEPVALRYGWSSNPDCNLYNKDGLPASPFRTDDWLKGRRPATAPAE
jgi:sialate O-acetylesterase